MLTSRHDIFQILGARSAVAVDVFDCICTAEREVVGSNTDYGRRLV
jgi:hypothetical protein